MAGSGCWCPVRVARRSSDCETLRWVGGSEGPAGPWGNRRKPGDGVGSPARTGRTRQNTRILPLSSCNWLWSRRRSISRPCSRSPCSASKVTWAAVFCRRDTTSASLLDRAVSEACNLLYPAQRNRRWVQIVIRTRIMPKWGRSLVAWLSQSGKKVRKPGGGGAHL